MTGQFVLRLMIRQCPISNFSCTTIYSNFMFKGRLLFELLCKHIHTHTCTNTRMHTHTHIHTHIDEYSIGAFCKKKHKYIDVIHCYIYYSCVFGKRNYRVLVRASVCVCVCFCTITQKEIDLGTRKRNTL